MTDNRIVFPLCGNINSKEFKNKSVRLSKFCIRITASLEKDDKSFVDIINIWREKVKKFRTAAIYVTNEKDQIVGFLLAHITEKDPLQKHKIPWILDILYLKNEYKNDENYKLLFDLFLNNYIKNRDEKGSGITTFLKTPEINSAMEKLGFQNNIKSETGTSVPLTIYRYDVNI